MKQQLLILYASSKVRVDYTYKFKVKVFIYYIIQNLAVPYIARRNLLFD